MILIQVIIDSGSTGRQFNASIHSKKLRYDSYESGKMADTSIFRHYTKHFTPHTDTFVYSVQPYNQNNGSPPPLFNNRTATPLYDLGLTYNASYGSGNGLSNTLGTSLLSDVKLTGTDLIATNLTFADLYTTTNGVGASGLLGLGFPLNGNIWSVSYLNTSLD